MSSYDTHAQKQLGDIALATEQSAVSEAAVILLGRVGHMNSEKAIHPHAFSALSDY